MCNDVEPSGYETYRFTRGKFQMKTRLLKESDLKEDGDPHRFMVWDNLNNRMTYFDAGTGLWEGETWEKPTAGHEGMQEHLVPGVSQGWVPDPTPFDPEIDPALYGEFEVELKDGKKSKVTPVWQLFTDRALYLPDVTFTRDGEIRHADVLAIPEPNRARALENHRSEREVEVALGARIEALLRIAAANGAETLIVGAFGAGPQGFDAEVVIELFRAWIAAHPGAIGHITFAVPRAAFGAFDDAFGEVREAAPQPTDVTADATAQDDEDEFDPNDLPEGVTFRS